DRRRRRLDVVANRDTCLRLGNITSEPASGHRMNVAIRHQRLRGASHLQLGKSAALPAARAAPTRTAPAAPTPAATPGPAKTVVLQIHNASLAPSASLRRRTGPADTCQ